MKKIAAALMAFGLLPLAGCATPHGYASGPYAGYSTGPYAAYDADYDQGYDGYGPDDSYYGPPAYGPNPGPAAYPAPGYAGQACCGQPYGQSYGPAQSGYGYSQSGYSSSYYSAPPPPVRYPAPVQPSSYYSTQYSCGCAR